MGVRTWRQLLAGILISALAAPTGLAAAQGRGQRIERREHARAPLRGRNTGPLLAQRPSRGYQEPAFANGFDGGYERGLSDGRDGDRYDPVRHRDYREADKGYGRSYGSLDAYKNNFRAGFRQGYERGYRDGARYRR